MDFMKGIVILVKVDEMYNIVKFASQVFIGREIKIELDDQRFCWRLPLNVHTLLRLSFIKWQASSCKRYGCRERV